MKHEESESATSFEAVARATKILRGQSASPGEMLVLALALKGENRFGLARRILARARIGARSTSDKSLHLKILQQYALCTYKDPDLPSDTKLDRAIEILNETATVSGQTLSETNDQETLGIAGAIHKRRWEIDAQKEHLERSLAYYSRGYDRGAAGDFGYTGINAAFVLDLLADLEAAQAEAAGFASKTAESRRLEARHIREDIVKTVPPLADEPRNQWLKDEWWFSATIAEAFFGLGRYDEARPWLKKALDLPKRKEWEYESTARQLATLARMHDVRTGSTSAPESVKAWDALQEFLGSSGAALRSASRGKVGLALSGGGFRASLFHIGVLAKLAELDVLRSVEVLSCVSGGSVIGAHYYLEVRRLLQTSRDEEITREDYVEIVRKIEKDFLEGVQRNIRTRVAADWLYNLKMILLPNHSRTLRAGELFESELFARVDDGEGLAPRWVNKLFVKPLGWTGNGEFAPRRDNWQRSAKVPILILNATTLNTGHNWQFTASWMGEPPAGLSEEIDANDRLRRMYYNEAPPGYRSVRLGHAVAASACVPGIFEPLALPGLYPDRVVRLVDGGVHDNQGIAGLLEESCTVLLVSDASGQMSSQNRPGDGLVSVPLRSNSILQARVREAQYREVNARRRASLARGVMFVHLKKNLDVDPVPWIGCDDPPPEDTPIEGGGNGRKAPLTSYGIRKDVQRRLAAIRTDLDSFSDMEANALMTSGYRMTEHEFPRSIEGFSSPPEERVPWRFLQVEPLMDHPDRSEGRRPSLMKILDVAVNRGFKVWRLQPLLSVAGAFLAFLALAGLTHLAAAFWTASLLTVRSAVLTLITLAATFIAGPVIVGVLRYKKTLTEITLGIILSLFGTIAARLHLNHFDKWYLRLGTLNSKMDASHKH